MSGREIILNAVTSALRNVPGYESLGWEPGSVREGVADDAYVAIKNSLTAAGYRLLAPGQIDPETRERCITAIDAARQLPINTASVERVNGVRQGHDRAVAAIRSLGDGQ